MWRSRGLATFGVVFATAIRKRRAARRILFAVLLVVGAMARDARAASTLTITPTQNVTAGEPIPLTVSGTNEGSYGVLSAFAIASGSTCPKNSAETTSGSTLASGSVPAPGPFSVGMSITVEHGGTYLLCGYFTGFIGETTVAESVAASATLVVSPTAQEVADHAKSAGEQAPVSKLKVKVTSHHGSSYGRPGYTGLVISTSAFANVVLTVDHGVGTKRWQQPANGRRQVNISWSCRQPGLTYHYAIKARGDSGGSLARSGKFESNVTAEWCRDARVREIAAEHAKKERKRRQEREPIERYERQCRAIGGIPVKIESTFPVVGGYHRCRSQTGGLIPVPGYGREPAI